ncbi:MAG: sugar phosphate nucleotidyltransferase [Candidatus Limnocylindria bacterium]
MKGIILAGGTGARLDPLTRITNKHLLPVYDRPMIYFAIEQLAGAGLDRLMIVTGGNHAGEFLRLLGNGSAFGLRHLDYAYQDRAGGIAEALGLCEWFAAGEPVVVLLGDNIFEHSVAPIVQEFAKRPSGARLTLAEVDNASAYGVAEMDGDRLVRIVEKPKDPPSRFAVTGLYCYDGRVFDMLKELLPSGRGELEITDVNNRYLELGELSHEVIAGYWADCGESIDMLFRAGRLVSERGANKAAGR